jgi:hypothetical protein
MGVECWMLVLGDWGLEFRTPVRGAWILGLGASPFRSCPFALSSPHAA